MNGVEEKESFSPAEGDSNPPNNPCRLILESMRESILKIALEIEGEPQFAEKPLSQSDGKSAEPVLLQQNQDKNLEEEHQPQLFKPAEGDQNGLVLQKIVTQK